MHRVAVAGASGFAGALAAHLVQRHPKLELAHTRDQRAAVIAAAIAKARRRPFALARLQRLFHLCLQHLLKHRLQGLAKAVGLIDKNGLERTDQLSIVRLGHGGHSFQGISDVEHHQPAMTALSQRICRTLSTLPEHLDFRGQLRDRAGW